jgi:hypothetical protein
MAQCPECGVEVASRHVACPNCGRSLSDATVAGLPAQSPGGRNDITATTRQRLADLAGGWELPAEKPIESESERLVTEPFPKTDEPSFSAPLKVAESEAAARGPEPNPGPPPLPRRIPSGTVPMEVIKSTAPAAPPPPPPEAVLPVRQAKSVSTEEIDAMLGPPMRLDPTVKPRSETNEVKPLPAPEPLMRKDPTNTQDTTRTVMELPNFAKGQPPSGVFGSIVYTARALRAGVDRALALRRLRADAVEKQQAREERLMELGELALAVPKLVNAALDSARPHISTLDDIMQTAERERGAIVANIANEERQAAEAARASEDAARAIQTKMSELDGRIRPLAAEQKQREKDLRDAEQTISGAGKKLDSLGDKKRQAEGKGLEGAADVADAAARMAALRAEVEAAERVVPTAREVLARISPELEQLRVGFEALRTELDTNQKTMAAREQQKKETLKKLDERRASIDRELSKAQDDRKIALRDLGAKLDWDRIQHPELAPRYRALDEIAGGLTAIDYQIAELEREAGAVDKKALAIASVVVLGAGALIALVIWLMIR